MDVLKFLLRLPFILVNALCWLICLLLRLLGRSTPVAGP